MRLRVLCSVLAAVVVLAGCGQAASVMPVPGVTLAPPTHAGMQELSPEPVRLPTTDEDD